MSHGEFGRSPSYGTLASSNVVVNYGHSSRYQDGGGERFQNLSDMVSINIIQINKNTAALEETLKQFIGSKGGQQEMLKQKSIKEFQAVNDLVTKTVTYLKEMFPLCGGSSLSARQRHEQFKRLKGEFWDSILHNLSMQNRQDGSKIGNDFGTEKSNLLENDQRRQAKQEQIREQEERWRHIAMLTKVYINDVTAISRDLEIMVHDPQVNIVENVERRVNVRRAPGNIQRALDTHIEEIEEPIVQPKKAEKQRKKFRTKKCILLGVVVTVVAAIVSLIIFLSV